MFLACILTQDALERVLRECVRDQPAALRQLVIYLRSICAPRAEGASSPTMEDEARAVSPPSVLVFYGVSSGGKSTAADLSTLMVLRLTYDLPVDVVLDPERELKRWCRAEHVAALACMTINMSDYGNKPAQVMELIAQRFRDLNELIDDHGMDPDAARPLKDVVFRFDEIHLANAQVLQAIAELANTGEVATRASKGKGKKGGGAGAAATSTLRCPGRLTLMLIGNSSEDSVLLRVPSPTQAQVAREMNRVLFKGIERVYTRFMHWVVPFYPYSKAQWTNIVQTCLGRLRQELCARIGHAHVFLHDSCTIFAQRCFKIHEWRVRSAMKQLGVSFHAAVMPDRHILAGWQAVLLRVEDGRVVVDQVRMRTPRVQGVDVKYAHASVVCC